VVRFVTTPVSGAARAVAAHSIRQTADERVRSIPVEVRIVLIEVVKGQRVQFSIVRLGMRLNSRSLLVTSVSPS
jgi:hypothetical protein